MFQRILVPVDGTKGSERAISYAVGLAQAVDAEVIVCRVLPAAAAPSAPGEERSAARYVTGIAKRFRDADVAVKTLVRRGEAPLEINKAAVEWNVDAIVMATRGRRRLQKLMLGSVADVVVRESRLPVLLVSARGPVKGAAAFAA